MKLEPTDNAERVFLKTVMNGIKEKAIANGDRNTVLRIELVECTDDINRLMGLFRDFAANEPHAFTGGTAAGLHSVSASSQGWNRTVY